MLYDISLAITYSFDSPAVAVRNLLHIQPRNLPGHQQLISGLIDADPRPDFRRQGADFFGNVTTEIAYEAPLSEIRFRFAGRVRRQSRVQELDLSPRLDKLGAEIAAIRDLGAEAPHHFTGPSDRVASYPAITAFARNVVSPSASALSAALEISAALHREMSFDPDATSVDTTPLEAFTNRHGVCQDFTHVMIAALRGIGLPAGYVSGFLRTVPPEGQPRLEGADAMHAWVQVWCGAEMGWVQIDPTNNLLVGGDHIVVAVGRDYADVAPVKGSVRSAGGHETRHKVDVVLVAP